MELYPLRCSARVPYPFVLFLFSLQWVLTEVSLHSRSNMYHAYPLSVLLLTFLSLTLPQSPAHSLPNPTFALTGYTETLA